MSTPGTYYLSVDQQEHWAWFDHVFSADECAHIVGMFRENVDEAGIFSGLKKDVRRSNVKFFHPHHETNWIFERLANVVNSANSQFFGFDLVSMSEGIQFTEYAGAGAHYTWHVDKGLRYAPRKLSLTVQISDSSDYEGGNLEIWYDTEPLQMTRDQGSCLLFPSTMLHRVTPVTSGTRYSLVAWVTGPPFR